MQPILSDRKYELDVEFKLQSDEDQSHGMSIMLLKEKPSFPDEFHNEFGYRPDYMGLGVFLYRSESRNKWVSHLHLLSNLYHTVFDGPLKQWIELHNVRKKFG